MPTTPSAITNCMAIFGLVALTAGPYAFANETTGPSAIIAEMTANTYAQITVAGPACNLRPREWGNVLRTELLAAVKEDRPDLLGEVQSIIDDDTYFVGHHTPAEIRQELCSPIDVFEDNTRLTLMDDAVISGASVWDTSIDPRGKHHR